MFQRTLQITKNYNAFLFGARSTGKTTLLQQQFSPKTTHIIDLLDLATEDRFARHPEQLLDVLTTLPESVSHVVIDEIQKNPRLLDVIHQYVQKHGNRFHFILTGSSAKKLKSGGADLLAGRAFVHHLFPLTFLELNDQFDLASYLQFGGLPGVFQFDSTRDRNNYLRAYGLMYLKEEIWNEHLVRKLDPFRMFLELAAESNGEIINYRKIANQVRVDSKTVAAYYSILAETLIGFELNAWHTSVRKQLISSPRFYLIDPGIKRALDNTLKVPLLPRTSAFGKAFEHFVISQIFFLNHYLELDFKLFYLKTKDGAEIDLIIEKPDKSLSCIEIKSTEDATLVNTANLRNVSRDLGGKAIYCFSNDPLTRVSEGVTYIHWKEGILQLCDTEGAQPV